MKEMNGLAKGISMKMSKGGKEAAQEIIGTLFMSRTYAHMAHLKTPTYSRHVALNEFYDNVVELADQFAEVAQGKWGKLDIPAVDVMGNVDKPIEALEMHMEEICELGMTCGSGALKNILDEIEALYLKTIYLMRELS